MIRTFIDNYKAWQERREEKLLAKWPRERELGMISYLLKTAIPFSMAVCFLVFTFESIFIELPSFSDIYRRLIGMIAVGLYVGYSNWTSLEKKYQTKIAKFSSTMRTG